MATGQVVKSVVDYGGEENVKQSHYRPGQEVEARSFQDTRHMKVVRFSAESIGRLYLLETFLVLVAVRG
jgi:hypothetical protein